MGSSSSNVFNEQNFINNNVNSTANNECKAYSSTLQNDGVFIIKSSNLKNTKVGIYQQTQTDASCTIMSSMQTQIQNTITDIINQTASSQSDLFSLLSPSKSSNTINIVQSISNNINNINNEVCSSSSITSQEYEYFYISGSNVTNSFIGISNQTNTSSSCSMANYISTQLYNAQMTKASQKASATGMLGTIAGMITSIMIIIVVGAVAGVIFMVVWKSMKEKKGKTGGDSKDEKDEKDGKDGKEGSSIFGGMLNKVVGSVADNINVDDIGSKVGGMVNGLISGK